MKRITIGIGELFASDQAVVISTVLGSCVSVCLFDPVRKIGGMNHIFLPGNADYREFNASARYGINAMELLINSMLSLSADRRRLLDQVGHGLQFPGYLRALEEQHVAVRVPPRSGVRRGEPPARELGLPRDGGLLGQQPRPALRLQR